MHKLLPLDTHCHCCFQPLQSHGFSQEKDALFRAVASQGKLHCSMAAPAACAMQRRPTALMPAPSLQPPHRAFHSHRLLGWLTARAAREMKHMSALLALLAAWPPLLPQHRVPHCRRCTTLYSEGLAKLLEYVLTKYLRTRAGR